MRLILKEEYNADCYAINEMKKYNLNTSGFYILANAYSLKIKYICQTGSSMIDLSSNLSILVDDNKTNQSNLFKLLSKESIDEVTKILSN